MWKAHICSCSFQSLMPIYTWLECQWVTDWHIYTHTHTGTHTALQARLLFSFCLSKVMCTTTIHSGITQYNIAQKEKWKRREKDTVREFLCHAHTHTRGARVQMVLTVFQCCGGYSLAWSWDPVHGSPLWCHCRYTGLGRRWHCSWAEQRASPPTSRVPCLPQNSYLWQA